MEQGSSSLSTSTSDGDGIHILQPKHKVFLSHSGAQKGFVEQLCVDLERCDRHPFFDKRKECLPIGKDFPRLIFEAIEQCEVGVVVLSEEFFTSKWPMLELVAMTNVQRSKPSFTIMPILLGITLSQCRDANNCKRWSSLWQIWAESDSRIELKEWESVVQLFGPTNALKYNLELGEVKFREEIVEAICALVPPTTRFEDSHIQGRSRLCKVLHKTIKESKMSLKYGVHIVGIYGVGGIGKTTICKAICNDALEVYQSKVAHVELGSQSEEVIMKEVLRKLTDKNLEVLGAMDLDQYRHHLMRDMMNAKVFLTIDNVSSATTSQALTLLRANFGLGSVVLVTARSRNELLALRIDASACMEMPELEMEEARSLFLYHASCIPSTYLDNKDDHELISSCVKRCCFKKGNGNSLHYHPLALQVLGEQLGSIGYDRERWWLLLHELDFLNPFGEVHHPVFSILRRSFDALNPQDQLLFMDVALYVPDRHDRMWFPLFKWNLFEWLGMVHDLPVKRIMERLENLKRKSVLENLGDGFGQISMHDLWREFARLETKAMELEKRRWMYERNAHEEDSLTNGGCLVNMRRMFFLGEGLMKLEDVNFSSFPNVAILKLKANIHLNLDLDLDLSSLKHLRSLELDCDSIKSSIITSIIGLGSLLKLGFLRCSNIPSISSCNDEISCLGNLRVLCLSRSSAVPNLSNLLLLQVASFQYNISVVTLHGLNSKHTNLQFLDLCGCRRLKSCPGVGDLVMLQELCLSCCFKLKEVPNLRKLKHLWKLDVINCNSLRSLPGLGDLVNLQELHAPGCKSLVEVPNMCNLQKLKVLDLRSCELIKSLPGLEDLACLQSLHTSGSKNLIQLPNMHKLRNLRTLELDPHCPLQSSIGWGNLELLRNLHIGIDELHDGPIFGKLTRLEGLEIFRWQGQGFSSVAELVLLESLIVTNCKGMCVLPNLQRLSRLHILEFSRCEFEDLSSLMYLTNLVELEIIDCDKLHALPDLQRLTKLKKLKVKRGAQLRDVYGIFGLRNLEWLRISGYSWLHENLGLDFQKFTNLKYLNISNCGFVDLQGLATCSRLHTLICKGCPIQELLLLANFPKLVNLNMQDCVNLTKLACIGPLNCDFAYLDVSGCKRLLALPDLTNSRKMQFLNVSNSGVLLNVECIQDIEVCWPSIRLIT